MHYQGGETKGEGYCGGDEWCAEVLERDARRAVQMLRMRKPVKGEGRKMIWNRPKGHLDLGINERGFWGPSRE